MTIAEIRNASGMTGVAADPAVNRQRSLIMTPEILQWVKEGRVYHGFGGVLTTPESGWATDLVRQTPIFYLRVPAGVVAVPILSQIAPEATGAAVQQVLVSTANNDIGTSNAVALTPVNVNTRFATVGSQVAAYATVTGATGTAPTGVADLFRHYQQVDHDAITGAPTPPITYSPFHGQGSYAVIGSSSAINSFMVYYANGTSSTGFHIHFWAEFTYDEFYG